MFIKNVWEIPDQVRKFKRINQLCQATISLEIKALTIRDFKKTFEMKIIRI
jgi:hypothetical protein